jgi:hypothetical protein
LSSACCTPSPETSRVIDGFSDLVNFIDIDNALLRPRHVAVGGLQQLENDVFHILADVSGLGKCSRVHNRKRHIQHLGQGVRQQRFAASRGANEQDVRLGQLDFVRAHLVHLDALVVVVDGDGELLLGLVLADHVIVEEALDLGRLGEMAGGGGGSFAAAVVFKNGVADGNALIADVGARIVAGRRDQLGYGVLRLVAERTA